MVSVRIARKTQPRLAGMIQEEHHRTQILVLILEVTLPSGNEMRRIRAEQCSQEQSLERLLTAVDLLYNLINRQ